MTNFEFYVWNCQCLPFLWLVSTARPEAPANKFFLLIYFSKKTSLFLKFQLDPMSNRWNIWSKCCCLGPLPWPKLAKFPTKFFFENIHIAQGVLNFFLHPILFSQSWDNWDQSLSQTVRQTDRKTNSLTPYTRVCRFFLSSNCFASHAGG